jgi:hypothetical protein
LIAVSMFLYGSSHISWNLQWNHYKKLYRHSSNSISRTLVTTINSLDGNVEIVNLKSKISKDPELESLSDWVRTIRSLVQGRIRKLKNCVNSRPKSVFKDQEVVKCLSSLHDKYVIVPDKASNNIVFFEWCLMEFRYPIQIG